MHVLDAFDYVLVEFICKAGGGFIRPSWPSPLNPPSFCFLDPGSRISSPTLSVSASRLYETTRPWGNSTKAAAPPKTRSVGIAQYRNTVIDTKVGKVVRDGSTSETAQTACDVLGNA